MATNRRRLVSVWAAAWAAAGCVTPLPPVTAIGTEADMPPGSAQEAPAAFDSASNGLSDAATFGEDRVVFDDVETVEDGLGPLYNAQSCRECHAQPVSGGGSQVSELRVGVRDASGRFRNPRIPIARGSVIIADRTLVSDRAICPSGAFPDQEIQQRVPDEANVRTQRLSLNLLGDGLVEAVPDEALRALAERQCRETAGRVCGRALAVPVLESPGTTRLGRFGWKNQHASLLSFAADAYLNEMGITSRLQPDEVTTVCDTVADPEDHASAAAAPARAAKLARRSAASPARRAMTAEFADIDRFARFMRATKAPPRDAIGARGQAAARGSRLFDASGCATCHVRNLVTAPAGTALNGGTFTVPEALGSRLFHPFGDFLMHDVGTGDGIETSAVERYGRRYAGMQGELTATATLLRTAPLWGLRMRSRLMHDGLSLTPRDAIGRHRVEAEAARRRFDALSAPEQEDLIAFLATL